MCTELIWIIVCEKCNGLIQENGRKRFECDEEDCGGTGIEVEPQPHGHCRKCQSAASEEDS
ncbi:hypothetical protein OC834_006850 [Tilletia horrida]|uniref:Uncharacterized protein n=1 Tax=Tilletia horrida TaxID=155126 RepID=A0AAN6G568_9BASI|nr:hypothetical protein OC834_006850 [Tilletia horrida]KAK0521457.1 hypothetical protein OC842_006772 [Tilletia horrida]KAK0534213.1 hypothetical protein OC835_002750 [Tilletia horrida]